MQWVNTVAPGFVSHLKVFEETIALEKAAFKHLDYPTEGVVEIE